jgi:hypothetical protein
MRRDDLLRCSSRGLADGTEPPHAQSPRASQEAVSGPTQQPCATAAPAPRATLPPRPSPTADAYSNCTDPVPPRTDPVPRSMDLTETCTNQGIWVRMGRV